MTKVYEELFIFFVAPNNFIIGKCALAVGVCHDMHVGAFGFILF